MDLMQALSEQAAFINAEVIPWVLRLVMAGLGLSLTLADFRRVVRFPKAAAIGLAAQMAGLPLAAFLLAWLFSAPPAIAVGLVILAACPSGVTANAYTFAARADVPLCVTLSAVTSVLTVFTIPFFIELAMRVFAGEAAAASLPAGGLLLNLVSFTLLPLALGMAFRHGFTATAERLLEPLRKAVLWLMAGVLILGAASSYRDLLAHYATAGALVVTMNVLTMGLGFGLGRLFRLPLAQAVTITFEVGVQNLALAFAIIFTILARPELAIAGLLYAVVMPATAFAFVAIARRLLAGEEGVTAARADAAVSG